MIVHRFILYYLFSISLYLISTNAITQTANIDPNIKLESWFLIPVKQGNSNDGTTSGNDLFFRRVRFGANGKINDRLSYNFSIAGDRWGIDTKSPEGGKYKGLCLWNAYLTTTILRSSDLLHLHLGYLLAPVTREANSSTWFISSLDKAYTDGITRKFISGKFNGIESGIALGGNYFHNNTGLMYRTGLFFPEKYFNVKNTSPLITCRLVFIAGEPEQKNYKYMLSGNPFHKRKGISLGVGGSHQWKSVNNQNKFDSLLFKNNTSIGLDLLLESGLLKLDAAYYYLNRDYNYTRDTYNGSEWHMRFSVQKIINKRICLQPSIMLSSFNGYDFGYGINSYQQIDIGCNLYFAKAKCRCGAHYIAQDTKHKNQRCNFLVIQTQILL